MRAAPGEDGTRRPCRMGRAGCPWRGRRPAALQDGACGLPLARTAPGGLAGWGVRADNAPMTEPAPDPAPDDPFLESGRKLFAGAADFFWAADSLKSLPPMGAMEIA